MPLASASRVNGRLDRPPVEWLLVEAGVNIVQVNMGNFGSWDLHGNNSPCLKNYLFPPTDRAVSALIEDLHQSGSLETTLVVMIGEFGRTPRITRIAPEIYRTPGRDHWSAVQTALFAGGGSGVNEGSFLFSAFLSWARTGAARVKAMTMTTIE